MNNLSIDAIICEPGNDSSPGAYYQVKLAAVPRVGEVIKLYSYLDMSTGHDAAHYYRVQRVVHDIRDVTEKVQQSKDGYHTVELHVVPCEPSPNFN